MQHPLSRHKTSVMATGYQKLLACHYSDHYRTRTSKKEKNCSINVPGSSASTDALNMDYPIQRNNQTMEKKSSHSNRIPEEWSMELANTFSKNNPKMLNENSLLEKYRKEQILQELYKQAPKIAPAQPEGLTDHHGRRGNTRKTKIPFPKKPNITPKINAVNHKRGRALTTKLQATLKHQDFPDRHNYPARSLSPTNISHPATIRDHSGKENGLADLTRFVADHPYTKIGNHSGVADSDLNRRLATIGNHPSVENFDHNTKLPICHPPTIGSDPAAIGKYSWMGNSEFSRVNPVSSSYKHYSGGQVHLNTGHYSKPYSTPFGNHSTVGKIDPVTVQKPPMADSNILRLALLGPGPESHPTTFDHYFGVENRTVDPKTMPFTNYYSTPIGNHSRAGNIDPVRYQKPPMADPNVLWRDTMDHTPIITHPPTFGNYSGVGNRPVDPKRMLPTNYYSTPIGNHSRAGNIDPVRYQKPPMADPNVLWRDTMDHTPIITHPPTFGNYSGVGNRPVDPKRMLPSNYYSTPIGNHSRAGNIDPVRLQKPPMADPNVTCGAAVGDTPLITHLPSIGYQFGVENLTVHPMRMPITNPHLTTPLNLSKTDKYPDTFQKAPMVHVSPITMTPPPTPLPARIEDYRSKTAANLNSFEKSKFWDNYPKYGNPVPKTTPISEQSNKINDDCLQIRRKFNLSNSLDVTLVERKTSDKDTSLESDSDQSSTTEPAPTAEESISKLSPVQQDAQLQETLNPTRAFTLSKCTLNRPKQTTQRVSLPQPDSSAAMELCIEQHEICENRGSPESTSEASITRNAQLQETEPPSNEFTLSNCTQNRPEQTTQRMLVPHAGSSADMELCIEQPENGEEWESQESTSEASISIQSPAQQNSQQPEIEPLTSESTLLTSVVNRREPIAQQVPVSHAGSSRNMELRDTKDEVVENQGSQESTSETNPVRLEVAQEIKAEEKKENILDNYSLSELFPSPFDRNFICTSVEKRYELIIERNGGAAMWIKSFIKGSSNPKIEVKTFLQKLCKNFDTSGDLLQSEQALLTAVAALELILFKIRKQLTENFCDVQEIILGTMRYYLNYRIELAHLKTKNLKGEMLQQTIKFNFKSMVATLYASLGDSPGHVYEALLSSELMRKRKLCSLPIIEHCTDNITPPRTGEEYFRGILMFRLLEEVSKSEVLKKATQVLGKGSPSVFKLAGLKQSAFGYMPGEDITEYLLTEESRSKLHAGYFYHHAYNKRGS